MLRPECATILKQTNRSMSESRDDNNNNNDDDDNDDDKVQALGGGSFEDLCIIALRHRTVHC